jgi:cob(I)alamin adenosyltransferase
MKIYTKTGDDGTTGLIGGVRVKKSDAQIEAYGTVDELNSHLGLLRDTFLNSETQGQLTIIQNQLFVIGSHLATAEKGTKMALPELESNAINQLEQWMDDMDSKLKALQHFILPGGHPTSSYAQIARCVCRRAERRIVEMDELTHRFTHEITYINRLSDYLFILARFILQEFGKEEVKWEPNR